MSPGGRPAAVDRRVRERRDCVSRQRGRRRGTLLVVLTLVVVAAGLFLWLRSSDVFAVKRITCTAVTHLTSEDISRATADARGVSLLRLSTGEIEERLAALPYVQSVDVHRRFPDTLEIELIEHEPVARVQDKDGDAWLVSVDGRVLERKPVTGLPLVVAAAPVRLVAGDKVPSSIGGALPLAGLLVDGGSLPALPVAPKRIEVSTDGEATIVLDGEIELRFGYPTELEQKLTVASEIIERCLRDGKELRYVDVRTPERVAVNHK